MNTPESLPVNGATSPPAAKAAPINIRYERITSILENEPAFRPRMLVKDQKVQKRNGDELLCARLAVDTTLAIHSRGFESHNVARPAVLKIAAEVLAAELLKPAPAPEPEAVPPKRSPRRRKAALLAAPEIAEPGKAEPVMVAPKPGKAAASKPVKAEPAKVEAVTLDPVKVAAPKPVKRLPAPKPAAPAAQVLKPATVEMQTVAVYSNVAKFSLLCSLKNLMDLDDDKFPGFEKRRETVNFLITEYCRLKEVPSPVKLGVPGDA